MIKAGYRVIRHPLVNRDIHRITDYLLDYTTPVSVGIKIDAIERDIGILADRPHRGTRHDAIHPGLRALPSARKGVIAFEVVDATRTVRVLCVTWGGANWMATVDDRVG